MRNILILGAGPEEHAWADLFAVDPRYRVAAVFPALAGEAPPDAQVVHDLDEALAIPGIDLVVVGGPLDSRGEALRRAAAEGKLIICIHPPGEDSEAYYQVSLSHAETGAVVVPDLPLRLHPGVDRLRRALSSGELEGFRSLRFEYPAQPEEGDLVREVFARLVDVIRALLGEVDALTASGDPPGVRPNLEALVQLRCAGGNRAEVRMWSGGDEPARLTLTGLGGSLSLEFAPDLQSPARIIRRAASNVEQVEFLPPWNPREALLSAIVSGSPAGPVLADGTRAMELSEAVVRSLRRGRTIDLHYETISEESTFKSVMTSTGCIMLLGALTLLPLSLAGPALGLPWTIYLAYAIPPVLIMFVLSQFLRFGIGPRPGSVPGNTTAIQEGREKPDSASARDTNP